MTTHNQQSNTYRGPASVYLSTLARLRALSPRRGLELSEAQQLAERQAALLLGRSDIGDVPVPLDILRVLPRIELSVDAELPTSGSSFWDHRRGVWRLLAKASEHPNRQRFSFAHEFKHVIDHPVRELLYASDSEREQVADHFAACVLMPKVHVTRAWCAGLQDVHELAEQFCVSPLAMARRIAELGLADQAEARSTARPRRSYWCARGVHRPGRFSQLTSGSDVLPLPSSPRSVMAGGGSPVQGVS